MKVSAKMYLTGLMVVALVFEQGCSGGSGTTSLAQLPGEPGSGAPAPVPGAVDALLEVVTESGQPLPMGFTVRLTDESTGFTQRADSDKVSKQFRFIMLGLEPDALLTAEVTSPDGVELTKKSLGVSGAEVASGLVQLGRIRVSLQEPTPARSLIAGGWIVGKDGQPLPDGAVVILRASSEWEARGTVESGRFTVAMLNISGQADFLLPGDTITFDAEDADGRPLLLDSPTYTLTQTDVTNRSIVVHLAEKD